MARHKPVVWIIEWSDGRDTWPGGLAYTTRAEARRELLRHAHDDSGPDTARVVKYVPVKEVS